MKIKMIVLLKSTINNSLKIDKIVNNQEKSLKNASDINFYRLIDKIDINQINSNDLYRFID